MGKIDPSQRLAELSVGEVAERSGIAVSTLHFYEAKGLIKSRRNAGNQRRYPRDVLRRVALIKVAQKLGVALSDIGAALATLPEGRTPTAKDWNGLSAVWKKDLDARIDKLTRLRDQLGECIGCGCLSLEHCKLRNPLDELSEQGSGARLLENEAGQSARESPRRIRPQGPGKQ